jgi:putative transposase
LRRNPSLDALIPALYLKGISTGDFSEALTAILGEGAKGLSSANIVRLKEVWQEEYEQWKKRDLTGKRYVYLWADGIYFNLRLTDERPCMLVVMGTTAEGKKELLAILDGDLGFWAALPEVFAQTREQRCWVHKTANVLDKMPKKVQPRAKQKIQSIYMAESKESALAEYDEFMELYRDKFPRTCQCLEKDKEVLFTFYDFPAAHWIHIRTTNPIESTFATVRHRTRQTKGCRSQKATLAMVYKLGLEAEKHWRRLNGYQLMVKVLRGVRFEDREEVVEQSIAV